VAGRGELATERERERERKGKKTGRQKNKERVVRETPKRWWRRSSKIILQRGSNRKDLLI
jgi:hypothetical protein